MDFVTSVTDALLDLGNKDVVKMKIGLLLIPLNVLFQNKDQSIRCQHGVTAATVPTST